MSKKRFMISIALVLVLALSMALLVACGGSDKKDVTVPQASDKNYYPANFTAVDYSAMEKVEGMDAFDLLCEVYDTWTKDKGYKRHQIFSFKAEPIGVPITNFCEDVYKIDGDKLYRRMVVIQDGQKPLASDRYEVTRFYWDGTKAMRVVEDDSESKTNIPGDPKSENGLFYVKTDPKMTDFAGDEKHDIQKMLKTYTSHMTTYIWNKRENLVDNGFNVYKAADGTLRFTIEINCSKEMMDGAHVLAREEFEDSTGATAGTVRMRANTTLDLVVGEVNGVKKIFAWRRTEQYEGKKGPAKIPASQTCIETFSYDEADYKITPEDIA